MVKLLSGFYWRTLYVCKSDCQRSTLHLHYIIFARVILWQPLTFQFHTVQWCSTIPIILVVSQLSSLLFRDKSSLQIVGINVNTTGHEITTQRANSPWTAVAFDADEILARCVGDANGFDSTARFADNSVVQLDRSCKPENKELHVTSVIATEKAKEFFTTVKCAKKVENSHTAKQCDISNGNDSYLWMKYCWKKNHVSNF